MGYQVHLLGLVMQQIMWIAQKELTGVFRGQIKTQIHTCTGGRANNCAVPAGMDGKMDMAADDPFDARVSLHDPSQPFGPDKDEFICFRNAELFRWVVHEKTTGRSPPSHSRASSQSSL